MYGLSHNCLIKWVLLWFKTLKIKANLEQLKIEKPFLATGIFIAVFAFLTPVLLTILAVYDSYLHTL